MEMQIYDEDMGENAFFVALQDQCSHLFKAAMENEWLITVPKTGSFPSSYMWSEEDFMNHVLIPMDGDSGIYKTASDKHVNMQGNKITTAEGFLQEDKLVKIVFHETFYSSELKKYQVLCLSEPLEGASDFPPSAVESSTSSVNPRSLLLTDPREADLFLFQGRHGAHFRLEMERVLTESAPLYSYGRPSSSSTQALVDLTKGIFTKLLRVITRQPALKIYNKEDIQIATETYLFHHLNERLLRSLAALTAHADAQINKTSRNMAAVQLRDLKARLDISSNIPRARRDLLLLPQLTTPTAKLQCIRNVISSLAAQPKGAPQGGDPLTSDDVLTLLIFLIIRSGIPNWEANFQYMSSDFRFTKDLQSENYDYYHSSLEAALQYIRTETFRPTSPATEVKASAQLSHPASVDRSRSVELMDFFKLIRSARVEEVEAILDNSSSSNCHSPSRSRSDTQTALCHPLCSCDLCVGLVKSHGSRDSVDVSLNSRDEKGQTALHMAALSNHPDMITLLLSRGATLDVVDFRGSSPLHVSCQKGFQNATVLLIKSGTRPDCTDGDGNTPLHIATANGHMRCVKALLYMEESASLININSPNDAGDTPLHLAVRWGYQSIVQELIIRGASTQAVNRRKVKPLSCSTNDRIAAILQEAAMREAGEAGGQASDEFEDISSHAGSDKMSVSDISEPPPIHPDLSTFDSGLSEHDGSPSSTTSAVLRLTKPSKEVTGKIRRLLAAVESQDMQLIKHYLGWDEEDSDEEEADDLEDDSSKVTGLCHPLCQCPKCAPVQKASRSVAGLSVNSADVSGLTPLHAAARGGNYQIVVLLLKGGADVNTRTVRHEYTPLHLACSRKLPSTQIVRKLLECESRVNARDLSGRTPLHYASRYGSSEVVKALSEFGSLVNAADSSGNTSLHEAARTGQSDATRQLLAERADPALANKQRLTPLQVTKSSHVAALLASLPMTSSVGAPEVEVLESGERDRSRSDEISLPGVPQPPASRPPLMGPPKSKELALYSIDSALAQAPVRSDLTSAQTQVGSDLASAQTQVGSDLTPAQTQVRSDVTSAQTQVGSDLAFAQTQVGSDLAFAQTRVSSDVTSAQTQVRSDSKTQTRVSSDFKSLITVDAMEPREVVTDSNATETECMLMSQMSISDTICAETLSDSRQVNVMSDSNNSEDGSDSSSVGDVSDSECVESTSVSRSGESVSDSKPMETASDSKLVKNIRNKTSAVITTRNPESMESMRDCQLPQSISHSRLVETEESKPAESLSHSRLVETESVSKPVESSVDSLPTESEKNLSSMETAVFPSLQVNERTDVSDLASDHSVTNVSVLAADHSGLDPSDLAVNPSGFDICDLEVSHSDSDADKGSATVETNTLDYVNSNGLVSTEVVSDSEFKSSTSDSSPVEKDLNCEEGLDLVGVATLEINSKIKELDASVVGDNLTVVGESLNVVSRSLAVLAEDEGELNFSPPLLDSSPNLETKIPLDKTPLDADEGGFNLD